MTDYLQSKLGASLPPMESDVTPSVQILREHDEAMAVRAAVIGELRAHQNLDSARAYPEMRMTDSIR